MLTMLVLSRSLTPELAAASPLPFSEGYRPPNIDVNGFQEGSWVGGTDDT